MAKETKKAQEADGENTQDFSTRVEGQYFNFKVTRSDYNSLLNALGPGNKVNAFHNFLVDTVEDSSEAELLKILAAKPGSEIAIGTPIFDAYTPDLKVTVKKL
ncbi:putative phage tail assembly chaperone [Microbulbifer sp. SSSA007]|uniref:putative phage tail assembly chaperone n=1 Tax=Microbulbifer sp. SSSA007 TaxID=3243379 RepID=UPI00403A32C9